MLYVAEEECVDGVRAQRTVIAKATPVGAMVGVNQRRGRMGLGPSRFVSEGGVADPHSAAGPQP